MKVKYKSSNNNYEVVQGTIPNRVTMVFVGKGDDLSVKNGQEYTNHCTTVELNEQIQAGIVKVMEANVPPPASSADLKITVDSKELQRAVELAKELEATLLRIKGMFV